MTLNDTTSKDLGVVRRNDNDGMTPHFLELMGPGFDQGNLCYRFLSDSILRLFYFTPRCLVDVTP